MAAELGHNIVISNRDGAAGTIVFNARGRGAGRLYARRRPDHADRDAPYLAGACATEFNPSTYLPVMTKTSSRSR